MTTSEAVMQRVDNLTRKLYSAVRLLVLVGGATLLLVASLNYLQIKRNRILSHIEETQNRQQVQIDELTAVADALRETTPEEQARNAAISAAVLDIIPDLKAILCEAFPESTACAT